MKDVIYITGHKNQTQFRFVLHSLCEFKNKTQSTHIPVRLGEINRETRFVLEYFDVEPPILIDTVKAQVSDLNIDKIAPISSDISLKMAWNIMKKNNVKTLPVTNENSNLMGIVSISNVITTYMDVWDNRFYIKKNQDRKYIRHLI